MNKFEKVNFNKEEQSKSTVEKIEVAKKKFGFLFNDPEKNREGISALAKELQKLNTILEGEIKEMEEQLKEEITSCEKDPIQIRSITHPYILRKLSQSRKEQVRLYVARNPNTPQM